jgi:hypothetical protein
VLNLVLVELFVLLVNRMEQAIALVLVISKWERRKRQASDEPQDAQRDRQTRTATCSVSHFRCSCCSFLIQERIFEVASTGIEGQARPGRASQRRCDIASPALLLQPPSLFECAVGIILNVPAWTKREASRHIHRRSCGYSPQPWTARRPPPGSSHRG